jgi:hypothetical protein
MTKSFERRCTMRRILVICLLAGVAAFGTSIAAAAQIWTVTETKAERMLQRDATVRLPVADRVALEEELQGEIRRFRALETLAIDTGNETAWWTYYSATSRYYLALQAVQDGLGIAGADCTGIGRKAAGGRFQRFDCLVTSEVLSIPQTEVAGLDGDGMPELLEGEPTQVGPLVTQVRVRVTGKSRIQYR